MVDAPFLINLVRASAEASARSAWKNSREEEEISRFGTEYAEMVRVLRRDVPAGSTVFIPDRKYEGTPVESDPMILQLWPQYKPVRRIDHADYILLFHPTEARYDVQSGVVILPGHSPIRAVPLVALNSEVILLKKTHDN